MADRLTLDSSSLCCEGGLLRPGALILVCHCYFHLSVHFWIHGAQTSLALGFPGVIWGGYTYRISRFPFILKFYIVYISQKYRGFAYVLGMLCSP